MGRVGKLLFPGAIVTSTTHIYKLEDKFEGRKGSCGVEGWKGSYGGVENKKWLSLSCFPLSNI